jgi:hypothetical protein
LVLRADPYRGGEWITTAFCVRSNFQPESGNDQPDRLAFIAIN